MSTKYDIKQYDAEPTAKFRINGTLTSIAMSVMSVKYIGKIFPSIAMSVMSVK